MSGFRKLGYGVSPEQQSLLRSGSFGLRPLGAAGPLGIWRVLLLAWQPVAAFVFPVLVLTSSLRLGSEALGPLVCAAGLAALLAYPAAAVGLLASGVLATRLHSRVRWRAALYWAWWPLATLAMCCLAAALGVALGGHLWQGHFLPYAQVERLQAYQHVDPLASSGVRLQDAGLVLFNRTAAVGRLEGGCHKNGAVYCVAPVRRAGSAGPAGAGSAGAGHHDLFMAGVDCCACPGEFRCGDWSTPAALGGIRIVDPHDNELYKLAAEDWSAAHGLRVERPLFFHWVADPLAAHRAQRTEGRRLLCLGLLVGPCFLLALAAALNGLLGLLVDAGYAAPVEPPKRLGASWPGQTAQRSEAEGDADEASETASDPKYVCL